ncbi:MAG TPA: threonine-phosphate decarboxylase [Gammaproteobacteria bacterium]|nr:threonine-phosphate decarboxylase [Gammaproteobacteria bacterium]
MEHGGRLRAAAERYRIPLSDWLDLSTGINPRPWPVPPLPPPAWARLPEDEDGLLEAMTAYYGCARGLPVAGSQAAIQALPAMRRPCRVGVLAPAYAEHAHAWRVAGHEVLNLSAAQIDPALARLDVLVLVNPNNPTGERFAPQRLLTWHHAMRGRGGWLVVDEAFMDPTPEQSVVSFTDRAGLIVLRSLGKFFGLAGARVGFIFSGDDTLLTALHARLGPWALAHPSRWVAQRALRDTGWQVATRSRLPEDGARLAALLCRHGLQPSGGTALFQWVITAQAPVLHGALARRGIFTRLFTAPASLRFGLPGAETQWHRLEQALAEASL